MVASGWHLRRGSSAVRRDRQAAFAVTRSFVVTRAGQSWRSAAACRVRTDTVGLLVKTVAAGVQ